MVALLNQDFINTDEEESSSIQQQRVLEQEAEREEQLNNIRQNQEVEEGEGAVASIPFLNNDTEGYDEEIDIANLLSLIEKGVPQEKIEEELGAAFTSLAGSVAKEKSSSRKYLGYLDKVLSAIKASQRQDLVNMQSRLANMRDVVVKSNTINIAADAQRIFAANQLASVQQAAMRQNNIQQQAIQTQAAQKVNVTTQNAVIQNMQQQVQLMASLKQNFQQAREVATQAQAAPIKAEIVKSMEAVKQAAQAVARTQATEIAQAARQMEVAARNMEIAAQRPDLAVNIAQAASRVATEQLNTAQVANRVAKDITKQDTLQKNTEPKQDLLAAKNNITAKADSFAVTKQQLKDDLVKVKEINTRHDKAVKDNRLAEPTRKFENEIKVDTQRIEALNKITPPSKPDHVCKDPSCCGGKMPKDKMQDLCGSGNCGHDHGKGGPNSKPESHQHTGDGCCGPKIGQEMGVQISSRGVPSANNAQNPAIDGARLNALRNALGK